MKTLVLFSLLLGASVGYAQNAIPETRNGWQFAGIVGDTANAMTWTRIVRDTAYEGKYSQAFYVSHSPGTKVRWVKRFKREYAVAIPLPEGGGGSIAVGLYLNQGDAAYVRFYLTSKDSLYRLEGVGFGWPFRNVWFDGPDEWPPNNVSMTEALGKLPSSFDGIMLEFADPDSTAARTYELFLDNLRIIYYGGGGAAVDSSFLVDRFGDDHVEIFPNKIDFGKVAIGTVAFDTLRFVNNGADTVWAPQQLSLSGSGSFSGWWQQPSYQWPLPPGGQTSLVMAFAPEVVDGEKEWRAELGFRFDWITDTLVCTGTSFIPPPLSVRPDSLEFDTTAVGTERIDTLRIANESDSAFSLALGVNLTDFRIAHISTVLAPHETVAIPVVFAPKSNGMRSCTITVLYDSAQAPLAVSVRGVGATPTAVVERPGTVPYMFALRQNYPNPFNPTTTISYEIPERSFVKLTVWDLLGKEVAVLVAKEQSAGTHQASFDARGLSSGTYLYRLETGSSVKVMKMLLIR